MKVEIKGFNLRDRCGYCTVTREPGDPKFHNSGWGAQGNQGESKLLYYVKKILNARGYDLIKKRIQKDGHMMGDQYQQYLRARKSSKDPSKNIYIYNHRYAIEGAEEEFNKNGSVTLMVAFNVFDISQKE